MSTNKWPCFNTYNYLQLMTCSSGLTWWKCLWNFFCRELLSSLRFFSGLPPLLPSNLDTFCRGLLVSFSLLAACADGLAFWLFDDNCLEVTDWDRERAKTIKVSQQIVCVYLMREFNWTLRSTSANGRRLYNPLAYTISHWPHPASSSSYL